MITLKEACNIAKGYLDARNFCCDLGDSWSFDWCLKDNPDETITDSTQIKVKKDTGKISEFVINGLSKDERRKFFQAPEIDISKYI